MARATSGYQLRIPSPQTHMLTMPASSFDCRSMSQLTSARNTNFTGESGGTAFRSRRPYSRKVAVVFGKADFVAIPRKAHVALLVIEEELQARVGPVLLAEVALHLGDDIHEFRLVAGLAPPQVRRGPFRVDGKIRERNRLRAAPRSGEGRAVEQAARSGDRTDPNWRHACFVPSLRAPVQTPARPFPAWP